MLFSGHFVFVHERVDGGFFIYLYGLDGWLRWRSCWLVRENSQSLLLVYHGFDFDICSLVFLYFVILEVVIYMECYGVVGHTQKKVKRLEYFTCQDGLGEGINLAGGLFILLLARHCFFYFVVGRSP